MAEAPPDPRQAIFVSLIEAIRLYMRAEAKQVSRGTLAPRSLNEIRSTLARLIEISVYRNAIDDERLIGVTEHVRACPVAQKVQMFFEWQFEGCRFVLEVDGFQGRCSVRGSRIA